MNSTGTMILLSNMKILQCSLSFLQLSTLENMFKTVFSMFYFGIRGRLDLCLLGMHNIWQNLKIKQD